MDFKIGSKIQAIDELGRWENGRVVGISEDLLEIKFDGWSSDFNAKVKSEQVRWPVDTFLGEVEAASQSHRRSRGQVNHRDYLSVLHTLCIDDEVSVVDTDSTPVTATVKEVDRFLRKVTVFVDGEEKERTVHSSLIVVEDGLTDSEDQPRQRKKKLSEKTKGKPQPNAEITAVEVICDSEDQPRQRKKKLSEETKGKPQPNAEITAVEVICGIEDGATFFSTIGKDGQTVTCGDLIQFASAGVTAGVSSIEKSAHNGYIIKASLLVGDELHEDITITAPSSRASVVNAQVKQKSRKLLKTWRERAYNDSVEKSRSCFGYRHELRKQQIKLAFGREVSAALSSKLFKKRFTLGIFSPESDMDILGLNYFHRRRVKYSSGECTFSKFDSLLGDYWDVLVRDGVSRFVTHLTVWLTKHDMIHGIISLAHCFEPVALDRDYRHNLLQHMEGSVLLEDICLAENEMV